MPEPLRSVLEAAAGGAYSLNREIIPEHGTAQGPVEQYEVCPTLDTSAQPHGVADIGGCLTPWDNQSKRIFDENGVAPTLSSGMNEGRHIQPIVLAFNPAQITSPQNGNNPQPGDACQTLDTDSRAAVVYALQSDWSTSTSSHVGGFNDDDSAYTLNLVDRQSVVCIESGQANAAICEDHAPTLNCGHEQPIVIDRAAFNQGANAAYPPPRGEDGRDGLARGEGSACGCL